MGAKGCPTLIILEGTMITCNQHILVTTYKWIKKTISDKTILRA